MEVTATVEKETEFRQQAGSQSASLTLGTRREELAPERIAYKVRQRHFRPIADEAFNKFQPVGFSTRMQAPLPQKKATHLKRKLWTLVYAYDAFSESLHSAQQYIEMGVTRKHPLHETFVGYIVCTYAKPFAGADHMKSPEGRFVRFEDPDLKAAHEVIIKLRHMMFAHDDPTIYRNAFFVHFKRQGRSYELRVESRVGRPGDDFIPDFIKLLNRQKAVALEEIETAARLLFPQATIDAVLKHERSDETTIEVFWPKE